MCLFCVKNDTYFWFYPRTVLSQCASVVCGCEKVAKFCGSCRKISNFVGFWSADRKLNRKNDIKLITYEKNFCYNIAVRADV